MEKHPLTTPGPYSTPPLPRHPLSKKHSLITMTPPPMNRFEAPTSSRTASPIPARPASSCASASYGSPRVGEGFRCSPKPHSSPKMKLRWRNQQQHQQNQQRHWRHHPHDAFIPSIPFKVHTNTLPPPLCLHVFDFSFFGFELLITSFIHNSFGFLKAIFDSFLFVVVWFRYIFSRLRTPFSLLHT